MKLKDIALLICIIAFTCGITNITMNSCMRSQIPGLNMSCQERNKISAKITHDIWGKLFDFEILENRRLADGEKVFIVWETGAFWSRKQFLELHFFPDNSVEAKFRHFVGHPSEGKFVNQEQFIVDSAKATKIRKALSDSNFWNSKDKCLEDLVTDGEWWNVEGLTGRKIIRWESLKSDKSSPEAQNLGEKIFQIMAAK